MNGKDGFSFFHENSNVMNIAGNMIHLRLMKGGINSVKDPFPQTNAVVLHYITRRLNLGRKCSDDGIEKLFDTMMPWGIGSAEKKDGVHIICSDVTISYEYQRALRFYLLNNNAFLTYYQT